MPEMDDDVMEGMADALSRMSGSQRKKLEALMNAKAKGIKKTKIIDKISFEAVGKDGHLSEYEEETGVDKNGGIVHKKTTKIKLFDCGHTATKENFGHVAECGHTACKICVEKMDLVCQSKKCMQKLCPKDNCYRFVVENMNLCKKHARQLKLNLFLAYFNLHDRKLVCRKKEE